jgi:hypothetical protein
VAPLSGRSTPWSKPRRRLTSPAAREQRSGGLFNTLTDAKVEGDLGRRDTLFGELRKLASSYLDVADGASVSRLIYVDTEDELAHRHALLDKLLGTTYVS